MPGNTERSQAEARIRWGEVDDDDEADLTYLLPPRVVTGPDENGITKTVEYGFNDDGKKVKVTTTTRIRKLAKTRLTKKMIERRSWAKFGDAVRDDVGSRLTMVSTEEINLERSLPPGTKAEEKNTPADALAAVGKSGAILMLCRACGKKGDHWTSKCPLKHLVSSTVVPSSTGAPVAGKSSSYIPPSQREGAAERVGSEMNRRKNEDNSVRVTNISEDTREGDLLELFGTIGPVSRTYVAVDQKTGMNRGFGFVNFVHREDAELAICKLNGYGYDNLIIRVEWAIPKK